MKNHTFAIIAYKESPYLQECIDSLKNQTIPSGIIICTSTPCNFLEDIASKNNLPLIINHEKNGIAGDWNFSLKQANAEYVTLAHQDDIYHQNYTEEIVKSMKKSADALIAFCNYDEIIHKKNVVLRRKNSLNFLIKKILNITAFLFFKSIKKNKTRLLVLGNPIGCPTVTFNKEVIGNFQFNSSFSVNLDWDAWHNLSQRNGSFIWIRKVLVTHRIHEESETSNGLKENRRQGEDLLIFKRMWPAPIALLLSYVYKLSYNNNK